MKEKIYTIPVNDAFAEHNGCPVCQLEKSQNRQLVKYYLGPSLMEPDVRKTTNQKGFCLFHLEQLYGGEQNRLGLGLIMHTHLVEVGAQLKKELDNSKIRGGGKIPLSKRRDFQAAVRKAAEKLAARSERCVICERVEQTMKRYAEVIFYEYTINPVFKERFEQHSFCLPHISWLMENAATYLKSAYLPGFIDYILDKKESDLAKLTADVSWFTQKFDYRNHDKEWKDSKDALPRSIWYLKGTNRSRLAEREE